jgi:Mlc titration factor MtfA (ptsG expression regulator)
MFHWLHTTTRDEVRKRPFPAEWEAIVQARLTCYHVLESAERQELQAIIQVLVAEKQWEGCGGLEISAEIQVTVAAHAALLLLGIRHDYYSNVESILIYPTTVILPEQRSGVFELVTAPYDRPLPILGLACFHGPVILVWDAVLCCARHPERGHNVVYHEFAHTLDMLDGVADGTPPLDSRAQLNEWVEVCSREYSRLCSCAAKGKKTFLDAYAIKNEAEFFAVATEEFFDRSHALRHNAPDLYHLLREFYCQDPAERTEVA